MTYPVLGRQDEALTTAETEAFLRERIGDGVLSASEEYATFTVTVAPDAWVETAQLCRDDPRLAYDMFDCLFGVDRGEHGFDVVVVLYSTSRGRRILLRTRAAGGREKPVCPSLTALFPGANWMERETFDMFGIDFEGHPGVTPRILTVENFDGWPLRKDFYLGTRAAKPWPGVKEPAETDEEGNVITKVPGPGDAPGPSVLDEVLAAQSKAVNPRPDQESVTDEPADEVETGAPSQEKVAAAASPEPPPSEADEAAADVDANVDKAAVKAEEQRIAQAKARQEKAAEQAADGPVAADEEGPVVPEGSPPAESDDEEA